MIQEYQPDPSRIPFSNLKPFHDSIMELRGKNASYAAIADLLIQNGVRTSRARVAEYGRIVLEGGMWRKRAQTMPASTFLLRLKVRRTWSKKSADHCADCYEQCSSSTKRGFSIQVTRAAHCQSGIAACQ